jgi:hypothetical protein
MLSFAHRKPGPLALPFNAARGTLPSVRKEQ